MISTKLLNHSPVGAQLYGVSVVQSTANSSKRLDLGPKPQPVNWQKQFQNSVLDSVTAFVWKPGEAARVNFFDLGSPGVVAPSGQRV